MSAWLKLKALAGGSLSLKVDDTLTTDEEFDISKGGIVSGSNANGNYIKYPDGTLKQYGSYVEIVDITASSSYGGYLGVAALRTFPIEFIETPSASCGATGCTSTSLNSISATTFQFYPRRNLSAAGVSITTKWQAIGRWK